MLHEKKPPTTKRDAINCDKRLRVETKNKIM